MWKYLLQRNIQRYRALLSDPSTSIETQETVKNLLADAQWQLSDSRGEVAAPLLQTNDC